MSGISTLFPESFPAGFSGALSSTEQPRALAPLMLVKRRAVDLCRVDSCLCPGAGRAA